MRLTKGQWHMLAEVIVRLLYRLYPTMVMDAWKESEHKRDKDGKFAATEGGSGSEANKSENIANKSENIATYAPSPENRGLQSAAGVLYFLVSQ